MNDLGKLMVVAGVTLVIIGAVLWSGFGRNWLGRLPGDIQYHRGNFSLYFPVVTCVLLSIFVSLLMWFFRK